MKNKDFDIRVCGDSALIVLIGGDAQSASHKARWLCGQIKGQKKVSDVSNVYAAENSVTVIFDPCLTSYETVRSKISQLISKNTKGQILVIGGESDFPPKENAKGGDEDEDQDS